MQTLCRSGDKGIGMNTQTTAIDGASPLLAGNSDRVAGATALTSSSAAVVACAACCVLPLALPAAALAASGGVLAWLTGAHVWITAVAAVMVAAAWLVVFGQSRRTGLKPHRGTLIILTLSTALMMLALAWPTIEPMLVEALK